MIIILDNIRSAYNVGSIIRTSVFFGVDTIAVCGVTPHIKDRFGRESSKITKVSLGAEKHITIDYYNTTEECIQFFKQQNVTIVAVEQHKTAHKVESHNLICFKNEKKAFVFGEETKGLSQDICDLCEHVVEIVGTGKKESLNVSVCVGIILSKVVKVPPSQHERHPKEFFLLDSA